MPQYRTIAEFEAKAAPTAAELALITACRAGEKCTLGDGTRPETFTEARHIRADLLRLLITGGTTEYGLADDGIWLEGAWIKGALNLRFAKARGRTVLDACHFTDQPDLTQSRLKQLSLNGSYLPGLFAQGIIVKGSFFLRNLRAMGTVDVNAAQIGGQLDCTGAVLDGKDGRALHAQSVTIGQSMFLRNLRATGMVDVIGAQIGGQLDCDGAVLDDKDGTALHEQSVKTGQDLFLRNLHAVGTVAVNSAQIGGQLDCTRSVLDGKGGRALNAQGVKTLDDLFLSSISAKGTVDVTGANIGGQLGFDFADLDAAGGPNDSGVWAIQTQGAEIGRDLVLSNVVARGTVAIAGAKVGGTLLCEKASFDGKGGPALFAQRLEVSHGWIWYNVKIAQGQVNLNAAHVGDLVDDITSWPTGTDQLCLDGFTYDRIVAAPTDATRRLRWLENGAVFGGTLSPQPYTQLAKVLSDMGHDRDARLVLMKRERLMAQAFRKYRAVIPNRYVKTGILSLWRDALNFGHWFGDRISYHIVGYGYRPFNSVIALAILFTFTAFLANRTWTEGSFAPNSDVVITSPGWTALVARDCDPDPTEGCLPNPAETWSSFGQDGLDWDSFNRYGYAADLVIPVLDLGQTDAWAPSKDRGDWGWWLWWLRWVLSGLGWVITALGAAAVTGIIKRDRG